MDAGKGTVGIAAGGLLMLLALVTASAAQTYKWVDEKGTVHFSNDPPAKAPLEVVPESARRPAVRQPPPADEPDRDAMDEAAPRRARAAPAAEDGASEEIIVEESETIVIDDGTRDPVTRYRANSPRNRPGQPIRQAPARQPRRGR
jgi:Domain of unknown function (DUF4124)